MAVEGTDFAVDDPTGVVGIRIIRTRRDLAEPMARSAPQLIAPMDATIVEITAGASPTTIVDRSSILLVPGNTQWTGAPLSATVHAVCLRLNERVRELVASDYEGQIDRAKLESILSTSQLLTRTRWLDELVCRYRFERAVCFKRDNAATRFLEVEMTKEVYFHCLDREISIERRSGLHGGSEIIERSVAHIERHLFGSLETRDVARAVGASESTLLRVFKSELGQAPSQYIRSRRLDESVLLLKSGRYTVSEVAMLVGYGNVAAFTNAFSKRFAQPPSELRAESAGKVTSRAKRSRRGL